MKGNTHSIKPCDDCGVTHLHADLFHSGLKQKIRRFLNFNFICKLIGHTISESDEDLLFDANEVYTYDPVETFCPRCMKPVLAKKISDDEYEIEENENV